MLVVRTEDVSDVSDILGTLRRTARPGQRGAEPHEVAARDLRPPAVDPRALRASPPPAARRRGTDCRDRRRGAQVWLPDGHAGRSLGSGTAPPDRRAAHPKRGSSVGIVTRLL